VALDKPEIRELLRRGKEHYCDGEDADICVTIVAIAEFPTKYGHFQIVGFYNNRDREEHVAILSGNIFDQVEVPVRIHSECLTGDVLGSLRCDCGDQLKTALTMINDIGFGILLYMRQEGRGIGLLNKLKAYQLQDSGYDTIEANVALGFDPDQRDYGIAAHMLKSLEVRSVRLITNNPKKIDGLKRHGIDVVGRIPLLIQPTEYSRSYLETKMCKAGHLLEDLFLEQEVAGK
jgi:GTP cyclohydrolase II